MTTNDTLKFGIAKKMFFFGLTVFLVVLITGIFKFNAISKADENFTIFKEKAVDGMFLVLKIEKELNYISRLTRDIMLGNDYAANMQKLQNSKDIVLKNFLELEETTKNTLDSQKKLEELKDSQNKMMAFIEDGFKKMQSLSEVERTPEVLASMYEKYKKDATPLANASRDSFAKIAITKQGGVDKRTLMYHSEIDTLKNIIIIESIVVLLLLVLALSFLTKDIIGSLNKFKNGLNNFFDFINKKSDKIELINIKTSDEFGQMANVINENIILTQNNLKEDQKLIDDVSIVISRVKHGWYSQSIQAETSNQTLNILKDGINDMIVGVIYGEETELSSHYKRISQSYPVIIGKEFWYRLTGKEDFYLDLIDAIGDVALEVDGSHIVEQTISNLAIEIQAKYFD